jgi:oxaloacetate decarboxylase alpha subunit
VAPSGELKEIQAAPSNTMTAPDHPSSSGGTKGTAVALNAPLSGNIFKVNVKPGQTVSEGEVVIILEAMKMETEVRVIQAGKIAEVLVSEGDAVTTGQPLLSVV